MTILFAIFVASYSPRATSTKIRIKTVGLKLLQGALISAPRATSTKIRIKTNQMKDQYGYGNYTPRATSTKIRIKTELTLSVEIVLYSSKSNFH